MPDALDDAAVAALWPLRNREHEWIGLLYETDEGIVATEPVSRFGKSRARGTFQIPAGSLRGIFHNHPQAHRKDSAYRSQFSDDDMDQVRKLRVPSFISAGDEIRKYVLGSGLYGAPVLAQLPWEAIKAQLMQSLLGRDPSHPLGLIRSLDGGLLSNRQLPGLLSDSP